MFRIRRIIWLILKLDIIVVEHIISVCIFFFFLLCIIAIYIYLYICIFIYYSNPWNVEIMCKFWKTRCVKWINVRSKNYHTHVVIFWAILRTFTNYPYIQSNEIQSAEWILKRKTYILQLWRLLNDIYILSQFRQFKWRILERVSLKGNALHNIR